MLYNTFIKFDKRIIENLIESDITEFQVNSILLSLRLIYTIDGDGFQNYFGRSSTFFSDMKD